MIVVLVYDPMSTFRPEKAYERPVTRKTHFTRHSERGKKTRQTEDEMGRLHQAMDRPGVRQVPEGSGEQGKMEETG